MADSPDAAMTEPTPAVRTDDDGNRWYTYPRNGRLLTSVTTITGGTHHKPHLVKWSAGLAARAAVDNLELLAAMLAEDDGRAKAIGWLRDTAARQRDLKADAGKYVHAVAEALWKWAQTPERRGDLVALPDLPAHLAGVMYDDDPLTDVVDAMVDGFTRFVREWNPKLYASEMKVYNAELGVAGTLDMILIIEDAAIERHPAGYWVLVRRPGERVVLIVDIKTGRTLDPTHEEQLAAYRRMTEADPTGFGDLIDMPDSDACAILRLRAEFRRGYQLRIIDRKAETAAWNDFRNAARLFTRREATKQVGRVIYPPTDVVGEFPDTDIADLEGYDRVPGVLVAAGIETLQELTIYTRAELIGSKRKGQDRGVKGIGPAFADIIERMLKDHGEHLAEPPQPGQQAGDEERAA